MSYTTKSLDLKLERIASGKATRSDFIIADAKDADMAFGIASGGPVLANGLRQRWKTMEEYRQQIRAVVEQGIVDIMLLSASNLEILGMHERLFAGSPITPAARANDTTDVWAVRGGSYAAHPSLPFRTATLDHIMYGRLAEGAGQPVVGADLGLYSMTFTNRIDVDREALETFRNFRIEAEQKGFRYFLEVFNPNVDPKVKPAEVGALLNDLVVRSLAGVTRKGRPLFLKIPYNGPAALEELASYDSNLVVGVLGGSAGTTLDAFQLIHDAQKYGARVALFGRKINLSEHPLAFIECLRRIADGHMAPAEAVCYYHGALQREKITPLRNLTDDLVLSETSLSYS